MQDPVSENDDQASMPDQLPPSAPSSSSRLSDEVPLPRHKPIKKYKKYSNQLKAILKPKISAKTKYFTSAPGVNDDNAVDVTKEPCPYAYPPELEELGHQIREKAWRNDVRLIELKKKCSKKLNMQQKLNQNLLKRSYVKDPSVDEMKTILNIDPEFFSIVEGRPIQDKLDIRSYIETVRESLRTKIMIGYREDDIMFIEENLLLEQQMIDRIKENFQTYVKTFEEFLYRDHTSAIDLLKQADATSTVAYDQYTELKKLEKQYEAWRSLLYNSEDKWRNCKMFQKFLYSVSPMSWRKENGIDLETESEEEAMSYLKRDDVAEQESSLSDLIKKFKEDIEKDVSPKLYFTDPSQLMDVFRFIEMQNLNSLFYSEELATPLANVQETMHIAKEMFDTEIKSLQETIDRLSAGISWEEERAKFLEDLARKLIDIEFRRIVTDHDVLNLHVLVEDVYETRVGPNDANLSMLEMMGGIEKKYRQELLMMDKVPAEQLALLEGSCYAEQVRIMRLAQNAARQYAELERVTYRLNKAYDPPYEKPIYKEPKKRSPVVEPVVEPPPPPRELTELEEEYLEYFTDFCKYTDDPKEYGINKEISKMIESAHQTPTIGTVDRRWEKEDDTFE